LRRDSLQSGRRKEQGLIISLVAVFTLFVVGAMAALAIDITSLYTARSEAQLAADAGALAGARVLANSGMTSSTDLGLAGSAQAICQTVSNFVAQSNLVGGAAPTVTANTCSVSTQYNPQVTVSVQANLPTFFARIWGTTRTNITASATAEAFNPSGQDTYPTATSCVKPLLLPNTDPIGGGQLFDPSIGTIEPSPDDLLGNQVVLWRGPIPPPGKRWRFEAGDTDSPTPSFPPPPASSVACNGSAGFSNFQLSIAGCVQTPIACNATVNTMANPPGFDIDVQNAVNCLTQATATGGGDSMTADYPPSSAFQFFSGANNPAVQARSLNSDTEILVSNSLVTLPVYTGAPIPGNPATIVGFVQLFLYPTGSSSTPGIPATVVNLVGCGNPGPGGTTIYGNGPSAVPVRLITP